MWQTSIGGANLENLDVVLGETSGTESKIESNDFLSEFSDDTIKAIENANDFFEKQELEKMREKSAIESLAKKNIGSFDKVSYGGFSESNPATVKITGKNNKYIIIPDLHYWYKNISCRKDFLGEQEEFLSNLMMYINSDETYNNVIFSGDIYHRSFKDLDSSRWIKSFFSELKYILNSRGGDLYTVIGNHEFSFSKNNPFWLQDGVIFKTPEDIFDNGVHIYLESFHSPKSVRKFRNKVECDICITHNEVIPPEIASFVRKESGRRVFTSSHAISFKRYYLKNLFVGHMHQIVDTYCIQEDEGDTSRNFEVQYLGSIGRTSVEEIDNDFVDRSLPVICIEGNEGEYTIEQLPIKLRQYHDTVIAEQVEKQRRIRQNVQSFKEVKMCKVKSNPIQEIKDLFDNNESVCEIIDCCQANSWPKDLVELVGKIEIYLENR